MNSVNECGTIRTSAQLKLALPDAELQNTYQMEASGPSSMSIRHAAYAAFPIFGLIRVLAFARLVNEPTKRRIDG